MYQFARLSWSFCRTQWQDFLCFSSHTEPFLEGQMGRVEAHRPPRGHRWPRWSWRCCWATVPWLMTRSWSHRWYLANNRYFEAPYSLLLTMKWSLWNQWLKSYYNKDLDPWVLTSYSMLWLLRARTDISGHGSEREEEQFARRMPLNFSREIELSQTNWLRICCWTLMLELWPKNKIQKWV